MPSPNELDERPGTMNYINSFKTPATPSNKVTDNRFQWNLALVLFGTLFVAVADTQLIPPLLPFIAMELGISAGKAGTIVTVYALAAAAFALLAGTLSDSIGRKHLVCIALGLFSTASLLTYLAPYFSILLWSRAFTGLAAGGISILSLSSAADLYSYKHRGKAMGIMSAAYFLAFVVAMPVGIYVSARLGWRWVFLSLGLLGIVMLFTSALALPSDKHYGKKISMKPLLAHCLIKDRLAGIVISFLTSGALVGFLTYVGVWLYSNHKVGIEEIGLLFMTAGVAGTVAAPLSGWLSDHIGKKKMIIGANSLLAIMFIAVANIDWGWMLFVAIALLSISAAARQGPLHALTSQLVKPDERGSYLAVRNAASQLGIATLVTLSASAFDSIGFASVAWIAALTTTIIPIVCLFIAEPPIIDKKR